MAKRRLDGGSADGDGVAIMNTSREGLAQRVLALDPGVRYVALAAGQHVETHERPGLADASSSESDRYEELLVNPALIMLARQRGEIDCGGLRFLVVGYGHFHQLIVPAAEGHLSVAFELSADPIAFVPKIEALVARWDPT